MIVSHRLSAIIDTISTNKLCDIGTDHAYIPIEAMHRQKIESAVACDVNQEPLAIGEKNIKSNGYEEKIKVRLSNGLSDVKKHEATTCTICGMGGLLVIDILKNNLDVALSFEQIILQPQSDIDKVREFIINNGFIILDERYVYDSEKYYTILNCSVGNDTEYSKKELVCGRNILDINKDIYFKYINFELDKCYRILENLKNIDDIQEKKEIFSEKIKWYKEVLSCIS